MSRKIKFRAWNIKEKVMCFDNEDDSEDYWDGVEASEISLVNGILNSKALYIFMQFTGLHDKNGKEIYEGDIVQAYMNDTKYGVHVVTYNAPRFSMGGVWFHKTTVIGNVHENPELLEKNDDK